MRRLKYFLLLFFIVSTSSIFAQISLSIQGKIIDKKTKESLPAYVAVEGTDVGRTAAFDGTFKLDVPSIEPGQKIKLSVYLIGYKRTTVEVRPGEFIIIELEPVPLASHEVTVSADSVVSESKVKDTVAMDKMEVYKLPGTAADPVYASQILPGVNSLPDSSTMLIRGGAPEEVAFYFDGIEVEHPFLSESLHESYFSIFDNQIIEGFSVSSSGFHSKFGDALSGVMDITAKDSIFQKEGGLGLSIMGLNSYVGFPIRKIGSFVGSFNAGHSYLMTRINNRDDSEFKTKNGFAKLNIKLNKNHTMRVLGLFDTYDFEHESGFRTNSDNLITGLSITSTLRKNLVTRLILSHLNYQADFEVQDDFEKNLEDNIYQARLDTSLDLESHYIEFGADIQSRQIDVSFAEAFGTPERFKALGTRLGMHLNDKFRISDRVYVDLGGKIHALPTHNKKINFDPRMSLAYLITQDDILRFSVGRYNQFGDYFTLEDYKNLNPKKATHFALSYDRIKEDMDLRVTVYNKEYRNLFLNVEDGIITNEGLGYARGAEFFLKFIKKRYDALFVYNFLSSKRKENTTLQLVRSPYEIAHSFTGIFTLKFNKTSLGIRYSFASGLPFTPLLGREWDVENQVYTPIWGEPYSERFPNYQRMDLNGSHTFTWKKRMIVLYFGVTNLLNNKNILRYEYSGDYSVRNNQHSIFGRSVFIGIYIPFF